MLLNPNTQEAIILPMPFRGIASDSRQCNLLFEGSLLNSEITKRYDLLNQSSNYISSFDFSFYDKHEKRHLLLTSKYKTVYNLPSLLNTDFNKMAISITPYQKKEIINEHNSAIEIYSVVDLSYVWNMFYETYELDKKSTWSSLLKAKSRIIIGKSSEPIPFIDQRYNLTKELIKILNYYNQPYLIYTSSDLVNRDEYKSLISPRLSQVVDLSD